MKTIRIICLVLLFIVMMIGVGWAKQWYKGVVHVHTTFSDGSDNVPQRVKRTKEEDGKFLIVTDHYEQIEEYHKAGRFAGKDFGFGDYVRNCREQTTSDFICIPGVEVANFWNDGESAAHTLALGISDIDEVLSNIDMNHNSQNTIVDRIIHLGYLPVAAHPTLITKLALRWEPWKGADFRYNLSKYASYLKTTKNIGGLEMFNWETEEQQFNALGFLMELTRMRIFTFVTAGCDSHKWYPCDVNDDESWGRHTWVYADNLSETAILSAMKQGRTIATNDRIEISDFSYIPSIEKQHVYVPNFKFSLKFDQPLSEDKIVCIIRDGEAIEDSLRRCTIGMQECEYVWNDTAVGLGEHWYIIYIKDTLISSPIILEVTDSSAEPLCIVNMYSDFDSEKFIPIGKPLNILRLSVGNNFRYLQAWCKNAKVDKISVKVYLEDNSGKHLVQDATTNKDEITNKMYWEIPIPVEVYTYEYGYGPLTKVIKKDEITGIYYICECTFWLEGYKDPVVKILKNYCELAE